MRTTDLERLRVPCGSPETIDVELAKALSVHVPAIDDLRSEIENDFDRSAFGIRWWTHLDDQRRVVISDHLVVAIPTTQKNLCEAALHLLEAKDAWEQNGIRHARLVQRDGSVKFPPTTAVADTLPLWMGSLHVAGYFRALGSTLDCLAAACIGIIGLRQNLLRADFSRVRQHARSISSRADGSSAPLYDDFSLCVDSAVERAGPPGWLEWCTEYRNMYIHRARRIEMRDLKVASYVVDSKGAPILHTTQTEMLLRAPGVSEVESFLQYQDEHLTLSEPASRTMEATLEATRFLVSELTIYLRSVWVQRRDSPSLVVQPSEQWPKIQRNALRRFNGFEPGSMNPTATELIGNPSTLKRLAAAGLSTQDAPKIWKTTKTE